MRYRTCIPLLLGGLTALCFSGAAHADIKITAEVTQDPPPPAPTAPPASSSTSSTAATTSSQTSGSTSGSTSTATQTPPQVVTTYYKGKKARVEKPDGSVLLYDGDAKKVYVLSVKEKTYYPLTWKQALQMPDANPLPGATPRQGMHLNTELDLDKTGLTQTVLGREVQKYTLTATVSLDPEPSQASFGGFGGGGFGRHGRGGGGGYGGGSRGGAQSGARPRSQTLMQIEGEYWLGDPSLLPEGANSPLLALLPPTLPSNLLLKELDDKIEKLKLAPLSSSITVRYLESGRNSNSGSNGGSTGSGGSSSSSHQTTFTCTTTAASSDPLDDSLFKVPTDYVKIDPAAAARESKQP